VSARRGIFVAPFDELSEPRLVAELAARAEAAGWDGFFLWDHLVNRSGRVVDPWTALGAVAVATERVTIGPLIVPLARRRPHNVALAALTLSRLAPGRVVLGAGLGTPPDFSHFGESDDWRVRASLLEEGLGVVRAYLDGEAPSGVSFGDAPRVPIWVGGIWPRRQPFHGVEHADGLFPLRFEAGKGFSPLSADDLAEIRASVPESATRDLVLWNAMAPDVPDVAEYERAGVTWWLVAPRGDESAEAFGRMVDAGPPR
jgi:alkanesulfonate monooxygenase SsuD/methylene tetrahydromethanopterin reductase-like flavin-dependent oxidoreductase (luciferase family)